MYVRFLSSTIPMPSPSGRINFYRLIRQVRSYRNYKQLGAMTLGAFCVGTVTLPPPSTLFNQRKELLDDHIISCPIQCYHEPIHSQLDKIREEVRPRSLVESLLACIHSIGYAFRLAFRSVQVVFYLSPAILSFWMVLFPPLRKYWNSILVFCFQRSGPSFMKFGQWAATRPDILPMDLCHELSTLHSSTEYLPFSVMKPIIERELGKDLDSVFDQIDETPVGSGCIAQVYRAHLRNTDQWVAIKVKRPDVETTFRMDLNLITCFNYIISFVPFIDYLSPRLASKLFTNVMRQQLDFRTEAVNLVHFRENFRVISSHFLTCRTMTNLHFRNPF